MSDKSESKSDHKCKYVLCINGGGVRDIFPARILDLIISQSGINMSRFDLIVGVSGGAILGLYMANNMEKMCSNEPLKLVDLFTPPNLKKMWDKSQWDHIMGEVQFSPVYDGKGKTILFKKYFGNYVLGNYATRVAVPVYNLTKKTAEIFTTYDDACKNYPVWSVADATSAAIPYYPPVTLKNGNKYIDGGYATNNPVLIAYSESQRLFGTQTPIRLLSIGTGQQNYSKAWENVNVEEWGAIQWVCNGLLDLILDAPNDLALEQTQKIMTLHNSENRLLHINHPIPVIKMDETSEGKISELTKAADKAFQASQNDLADFFNVKSCRAWNHIRKCPLPVSIN